MPGYESMKHVGPYSYLELRCDDDDLLAAVFVVYMQRCICNLQVNSEVASEGTRLTCLVTKHTLAGHSKL
jgi:hypothetical protein